MGSPETHNTNALAGDHDLLREYAERSSESSFRMLVERHGGMVYGVARRLVRDEHAAAEIMQSAFLALARKSSSLPRSVPLAGWLHTAARYAASHWLRSEARRRERERAASADEVHAMNDESERTWDEISPALDAALAALGPRDREAVLWRFFEQRSFSEVAAALGTTEDAAKMRVGRAVRKLRVFLEKRGALVSAGVLATCLTGHAAVTAPAHFVIAASQLAGSGLGHGSAIAALAAAIGEALRWARIKRILLTTSAVVVFAAGLAIGIGLLQARRNEPAPATTWDLTEPRAVESLLRDATMILGEWRAAPAGLAIDEMPWSHVAIRGPFAGDYRLQLTFTQQNAAGVVELLLPAGRQTLLILLRSGPEVAPDTAAQAVLNATLGPPQPPPPIEHFAEVEVRTGAGGISLSVRLDGAEIAATKDVPAALQRATLVPDQPPGILGLGASRTGAVFTRIEFQALRDEP